MHQYDIRTIQRTIKIEFPIVIPLDREPREEPAEGLHRLFALFANQVLDAPRILRFKNPNMVAARIQFSGDAPQKMSIAVIPIRQQRVAEENNVHRVLTICCIRARLIRLAVTAPAVLALATRPSTMDPGPGGGKKLYHFAIES